MIVPLYASHATLGGFLDALARQTFRDYETILVDSSPGEECADIVAARSEPLAYTRNAARLLPQAARNAGAARARGRLLVFTDPDLYPAPDWLERLVAAHRETGHVVVGALECHGDLTRDLGIHFVKFSKWLPGPAPHAVDMGPTAALLLPRDLFERVGRFRGDMMMGDQTLSQDLRAAGATLWIETRAVAEHHHLDALDGFLAERLRRGRLYGALRMRSLGGSRRSAGLFFAATVFPVRLATNLAHSARHASRAGRLGGWLRASPVVFAGFSAWLLGEALAYGAALLPFSAARSARSA